MRTLPNKIGVLIVEDHEATLKGLQAELGVEPDIDVVGIATRCDHGLRLAQQLKPQIVLLDLHLPDSSGPRSLAETFCALPGSKIIVFSGDSRSAILQLVLKTGVAGYLLKSEPIARVAQAIRDTVAGHSPIVSDELKETDRPKLTKAEQHLLMLLARGMKYQNIAATRVTSPETVRKQVDALVTKLSLESREELIAWGRGQWLQQAGD